MTTDIANRIRNRESFLLAADGNFVGKLTTNVYDQESICNQYGTYGSQYSAMSIWNQYSQYGSRYALYSVYNQYTMSPPAIYLRGVQVGYLTKNTYKYKHIDPDNILVWMKQHNL